MAPRKGNASVKSSGATSKKAEALPDWVKNGGKPPPSTAGPTTTTYTRRDGTVVTQTHLFPPNTKTPINLLHERITKSTQWNKPELRPHSLPGADNGFTCSVILTKQNKADASNPHRIEFRPPIRTGQGGALDSLYFSCDSAEKAKHWGATFGLFRLYSDQQFGRILPTLAGNPGGGPREYWQQMAAWLKSAEAKAWLNRPENADYLAADPFEALARREQKAKEKQIQEAARANAVEKGIVSALEPDRRMSKAWTDAKEVFMATALREQVERTIQSAMQVFGDRVREIDDEVDDKPTSKGTGSGSQPGLDFDARSISKALTSQGFRSGYVRSAIDWLQSTSKLLASGWQNTPSLNRDPLIASLYSKSLTPLEAATQYLILYVPEEDLPARFRSSSASDGFIVGGVAGSGTAGQARVDDLAWRWTEDSLVKEYKWPRKPTAQAVRTIRAWQQQHLALDDPKSSSSVLQDISTSTWSALAVDVLLAQLDQERPDLEDGVRRVLANTASAVATTEEQWEAIVSLRADERMAAEAILGEERICPVDNVPDAYDISLTGYAGADQVLSEQARKEDLRLRIMPHRLSPYPSEAHPTAFPTFAILSRTLPSYLCLAITKRLTSALTTKQDLVDVLQAGQGGVIVGMVEELDAGWWDILDQPPALENVMAGLIAREPSETPSKINDTDSTLTHVPKQALRSSRPMKPLRRDPKIDEELLAQQHQLLERADHQEMLRIRRALPAFASRDKILSLLSPSHSDSSCEFAGRVLIIAGETGCGKSTQTPQYVLEHAIEQKEGSLCNIVITQPRRVSAMGLAARVAAERGEKWQDDEVGEQGRNTVGYAIRGERKTSRHTRLLFTTTGVLLRRLSSGSDPDLRSVSHVLVDEVHERSVDSDLLLLELRELLRRNKSIKVILMSATIQQDLFVNYFSGAPCLEIPGRTYPVQDLYIEDIITNLSGWRPSSTLIAAGKAAEARQRKRAQAQKGQDRTSGNTAPLKNQESAPDLEEHSPHHFDSASENSAGGERNGTGVSADIKLALKGIQYLDRTDYELLGAVVRHVVQMAEKDEAGLSGPDAKKGGALLVFCSGVGEIRQAIEAITKAVTSKVEILPLHANLSPAEQRRVFQRPGQGRRKIVVSTNVAETSITIDDISYVVDTGRVKETKYNPESGLTSLVEGWASRAACKQRRGRAGRVRAGTCFKLFARQTELDKQSQQTTPEMLRVPLENVFLQAKAMHDDADLRDFLSKALSPPSMASMQSALQNLIECGAMRSNKGFSSRLSGLGRHLANLPLDVRLGKLLLFGALFGVLGPALSVAAIMSSKPLFVSPDRSNDAIASSRRSFAIGNSDLLTDASAFNAWLSLRASGTSNAELRSWCETNNISQAALRDVFSLRMELLGNLQDLGFARHYRVNTVWPLATNATNPAATKDLQAADCNATNLNMIRAVLAASLWPSIVRIQMPPPLFKESAAGALLKDPEARTIKYFDRVQGRVFLFGTSVCFDTTSYSSNYMAVFGKTVLKQSGPPSDRSGATTAREKVMMRDANEVPLYGLLLFGGKLKVNHAVGGISIGTGATITDDGQTDAQHQQDGWIKLRASGRIAVLCSQLRALLDSVLERAVEDPSVMTWEPDTDTHETRVLRSMVALITRDGL